MGNQIITVGGNVVTTTNGGITYALSMATPTIVECNTLRAYPALNSSSTKAIAVGQKPSTGGFGTIYKHEGDASADLSGYAAEAVFMSPAYANTSHSDFGGANSPVYFGPYAYQPTTSQRVYRIYGKNTVLRSPTSSGNVTLFWDGPDGNGNVELFDPSFFTVSTGVTLTKKVLTSVSAIATSSGSGGAPTASTVLPYLTTTLPYVSGSSTDLYLYLWGNVTWVITLEGYLEYTANLLG